jgi:ATP synthase protein I
MTGSDHTPPPARPQDEDRDRDLEARLQKARNRMAHKPRWGLDDSNAFGIAVRLVAELVSGPIIGAGIGWVLDRWLDTSPWLLVTFFILGIGAGLNNVMRAARQMSDAAERKAEKPDQKPDAPEE